MPDNQNSFDHPIDLSKFLSMDQDQATQFNFLTQNSEPDRCMLINGIYNQLYPWYNRHSDAGDTLNTYRIAIRDHYGRNYRNLDRKVQLEILRIISKYTPNSKHQFLEVKLTYKHGAPYYQVRNNYQLGNFGILPIHGGINPKRSLPPYFDYFDKYLVATNLFYSDNNESDDRLLTAINSRRDYFQCFDNMTNFVHMNNLDDFFSDNYVSSQNIIKLSEEPSFEAYVQAATEIISSRGNRMWNLLHKFS
ncbi:DUF6994 family protein [Levilactobacillus fujinensis]|uniref:DUF6994 family protein n=1 Tax=Levilactobacillus fujinensis TaxID=2486024 RepID=A0ABW1TLC5_9LACO|nr:hypothetical protein [Levilactobacillus fujinensis]